MAKRLLTEQMADKIKARYSQRLEEGQIRLRVTLRCRLCGSFSTTSIVQMAKHLEDHPKASLWQRVKCKMGLS